MGPCSGLAAIAGATYGAAVARGAWWAARRRPRYAGAVIAISAFLLAGVPTLAALALNDLQADAGYWLFFGHITGVVTMRLRLPRSSGTT